jgi:heptosyltransferase-2
VLVVQCWGIGDAVLTTPALRAIRQRWPGATVTLAVASPAVAAIVRDTALVDSVVVIPPAGSLRFLLWLIGLRRLRIDFALVATRHHRTWPALLRLLAGARRVAADSDAEAGRFATYHRRVALRDTEHRVDSNLALLELAAGPLPHYEPVVELSPDDERSAERVLSTLGLPSGALLLGIHPGSEPKVPQKRYPGALLRDVVLRLLAAEEVHALVFFGGEPADEREVYRGLHERLHVVADLPLRTVAALIARCHVFLAGDTGLAHIAAARGVHVVTIAGPTQVRSTGPRGPRTVTVATETPLACMPCYETPLYGTCGHVSCMTTLAPARVAAAVSRALAACRPASHPGSSAALPTAHGAANISSVEPSKAWTRKVPTTEAIGTLSPRTPETSPRCSGGT